MAETVARIVPALSPTVTMARMNALTSSGSAGMTRARAFMEIANVTNVRQLRKYAHRVRGACTACAINSSNIAAACLTVECCLMTTETPRPLAFSRGVSFFSWHVTASTNSGAMNDWTSSSEASVGNADLAHFTLPMSSRANTRLIVPSRSRSLDWGKATDWSM
eukprot:490524-Rhodomonas_salina.2